MMLYPLSDLVLFVVPTFHAHLRMALSTNFTYIVAPKGPTPAGQTSTTTTATATATATSIATGPAPAAARMTMSIVLPALSKNGGERAPLLREVVLSETFGSTGTTGTGGIGGGNGGGGDGGGAGGAGGRTGPGGSVSVEYRSPTLNVTVPVSAACVPVPLSAHARRHSGSTTPPSPTASSSPTDSSSSTDSFNRLPLLHIQG